LGNKGRWEYLLAIYERYQKAGRKAKKVILSERNPYQCQSIQLSGRNNQFFDACYGERASTIHPYRHDSQDHRDVRDWPDQTVNCSALQGTSSPLVALPSRFRLVARVKTNWTQ